MLPTKERNTTSILINYKSENILIDCGEGTQRQMRKINFSPSKLTRILITHWHGDHVLGLPGLLETLSKQDYTKTLKIYGPKGIKKSIENIYNLFINPINRINLEIKEISRSGKLIDEKDFTIYTQKLDHTTTCYGYSFIEKDKRRINLGYTKKLGLIKDPILGKLQQGKTITYKGKKITPEKGTILQKGKKITIILDTKLTKETIKFAKNSDLLISESTFSRELKDRAKETKHMTSEDAAYLAKKSNSKKLIITHFSQRNKGEKDIEKEAKKIFKQTIAAKDLFTYEL